MVGAIGGPGGRGGDTMEPENDAQGRTSRVVTTASWALVGAFGAAVLVMLSARWTTIGELASHMRWHLGLAAVLPFALMLVVRRWPQAATLAAVAVWGVAPEGVLWLGGSRLSASESTPRGAESTLHVASANVLRINDWYEDVFDAVLEGDPDVVCLLEISAKWRDEAILALGETYPHRAEGRDTEEWSRDTWGLLLFSKTPLTNVEAAPLWNEGRRLRPIVRADVELAGETVTLQLAHAQRPGSASRLSDRRAHFAALAHPVDDTGEHRILIGDLNTTSTSPYFADLCDAAGVRDSRAGFGRLPTWRMGNVLPGPFPIRLPDFARATVTIDHALVSDGLDVLHRDSYLLPGSDHFGIRVVVSPR